MAMKGYSAFPKAAASREPHHQIVLCHISRTLFVVGGLSSLQKYSRCILEPRPTGQKKIKYKTEKKTWVQLSNWYDKVMQRFWYCCPEVKTSQYFSVRSLDSFWQAVFVEKQDYASATLSMYPVIFSCFPNWKIILKEIPWCSFTIYQKGSFEQWKTRWNKSVNF